MGNGVATFIASAILVSAPALTAGVPDGPAGEKGVLSLREIERLHTLGAPAGSAAVAPLVAALNDPDPRIRAAAASALGTVGAATWADDPEHGDAPRAAQAALKPLAALIAEPRQPRDVRLAASAALAGMLPDARAVPALIVALGDADEGVRTWVCLALERVKARQAVPALEARLHDPAVQVQLAAARALLATGAPKHAVHRLARILLGGTEPMADKDGAASVLWEYPRAARPALPGLVRIALLPYENLIETMPSDGREPARETAAQTIDRIGAPAVPVLLPYVRAPARSEFASEQRARAVELVCGLGRAASSAFTALAPLVRAGDPELRGTVARCLVHLGISPRLVAPHILPLLRDRESDVVSDAVHAARDLGPAAAPALPRLRRLAYRGDLRVRVAAVDAIGNIGLPARTARATLEVALDDAEADVQAAASVALIKTGSAPAAGLRHLLDMLASRGAYADAIDWPRASAWRLGELAPFPAGKAALPALVAALGTAPPEIHDGIAHAIAAFGDRAAASALVPLTKVLERGSFAAKEACAALAAFGPRILPAVPALVRAASSGGNASGPAFAALLATARRSKNVSLAVKAECAKTSGWPLRRCRGLIREMDSRPGE